MQLSNKAKLIQAAAIGRALTGGTLVVYSEDATALALVDIGGYSETDDGVEIKAQRPTTVAINTGKPVYFEAVDKTGDLMLAGSVGPDDSADLLFKPELLVKYTEFELEALTYTIKDLNSKG